MVKGYENTDWQAGNANEGTFTPTQLFTGEDHIATAPVIILTGQDLAFGTIMALDGAGKGVPWDPASATAEITVPVGVLATAINTADPAGDRHAEIYETGCFNPDLLVWPAALATYLDRNSALRSATANFRVKRLL